MSIVIPGLEVTRDLYGDAVTDRYVVRIATTANGTLATAFANGQTVDGVVLATDDRILIKDQTTATEDGIYLVQAAGAPLRAEDLQTGANAFGITVYVSEGTANGGRTFVQTADPSVVGTNGLTMEPYGDKDFFGTTYTVGNVIVGNGDGAMKDTGALQIMDTNNNELITFTATGSAVNFLELTNAATGTNPILTATGTDPNVGFTLQTKGDAGFLLENDANEQIAVFDHVASAVNELTFSNAILSSAPSISATGNDTDISLLLAPKGTGSVVIDGGHSGLQYEGATSGTLNFSVPATITTYSVVYPSAQGGSGETLINDGSGNLTWGAPTAASKVVWNNPFQIDANNIAYETILYMPWDHSTYSTYNSGQLVFEVVHAGGGRDLEIQVLGTTPATLLATQTYSASAFVTVALTNTPTADSRVQVQVRRTAGGGGNPEIRGLTLEWLTS